MVKDQCLKLGLKIYTSSPMYWRLWWGVNNWFNAF